MAKTILVTGADGFIGGHLTKRLLAAGHKVTGLDRFSRGMPSYVPDRLQLLKADIRSRDIYKVFEGVDIVFHLAARNSVRQSQEDPVGTMDLNVMGTANVFDAAYKAGVGKVIYASSAVLDSEKTRKGFYAASKSTCELLADEYTRFGLSTVGLRYYNVFGPGRDASIISRFIKTLLEGKRPVLFEGDERNKRDFIHVDDVNAFHMLCVQDDLINNKVLSLGSGKQYSIKDALALIQSVLGIFTEPEVRPRPKGDEPTEMIADSSAAYAIGWKPEHDLAESVLEIAQQMKADEESRPV